jgi:alpha-N-acetylglucosamine transferase
VKTSELDAVKCFVDDTLVSNKTLKELWDTPVFGTAVAPRMEAGWPRILKKPDTASAFASHAPLVPSCWVPSKHENCPGSSLAAAISITI